MKALSQKFRSRLIPIGIAAVVLGGFLLWGNRDKFVPYPTWQVTERNDPSGVYRLFEMRLDGRGLKEDVPSLIIRCENRRLAVQLYIGYFGRIGGGLGSASIQVSEFFVSDPDGSMTGVGSGWAVPAGNVILERKDADAVHFIHELAAAPWFVAGALSRIMKFHVDGLSAYMPKLGALCDLTTEGAK